MTTMSHLVDESGRHDAGPRRTSRPPLSTLAESYADRREARHRRSSLCALPVPVLMSVSVGAAYGVSYALIAPGLFAAVILIARGIWTIQELGFRNDDPSWPARMPVLFARRLGGTVPSQYADDVELLGRLVDHQGDLEWVPSRQQGKQGVAPIQLGGGWHITSRAIWGPWGQRKVTLRRSDETVVLWARRYPALASA